MAAADPQDLVTSALGTGRHPGVRALSFLILWTASGPCSPVRDNLIQEQTQRPAWDAPTAHGTSRPLQVSLPFPSLQLPWHGNSQMKRRTQASLSFRVLGPSAWRAWTTRVRGVTCTQAPEASGRGGAQPAPGEGESSRSTWAARRQAEMEGAGKTKWPSEKLR